MSETIINGIDVSECPLYDKNTGCYHTFDGKCAKDGCAVYKWLLEYKRLQKENKRLQMLSCANCGEKYLSPEGSELYEKNVQMQEENEELKTYIQKMDKPGIKTIDSEIALKNIELQKENEKLKEKIKSEKYIKENALQEASKYSMKCGEFRQALKEIRKAIGKKYGMADIIKIRTILDEVLNDRN